MNVADFLSYKPASIQDFQQTTLNYASWGHDVAVHELITNAKPHHESTGTNTIYNTLGPRNLSKTSEAAPAGFWHSEVAASWNWQRPVFSSGRSTWLLILLVLGDGKWRTSYQEILHIRWRLANGWFDHGRLDVLKEPIRISSSDKCLLRLGQFEYHGWSSSLSKIRKVSEVLLPVSLALSLSIISG